MSAQSRTLLKNTSLSFLAEVFNRATSTGLWMLVAWRLGADAAGALSLALTYTFLATRLSFWGLDQLLIRDVARDPAQTGRYTLNFLALRAGLAGLAVLAVWGVLAFTPYPPETRLLIAVLSLSVIPENLSNICQAVCAAYERLDYPAWLELGLGTLKLVASGLALALGVEVLWVAWVLVADSLLGMVLNLWLVHARFNALRARLDWRFAWQQTRHATPFFASGLLYILDNRLDVLLLSFFRPQAEVGLYSAAANLMLLVMLLPQAYRAALFAPLARLYHQSRPAAEALFTASFKYVLMLAAPLTVGGAVLAKPIMATLYGPEFLAGAVLLQWLMVPTAFLFLNVLYVRLMMVGNLQWLVARTLGWSLLVNVALNVVLVPGLGALGVAVARLVAGVLVSMTNLWVVRRRLLAFDVWGLAWRPVLAALVMGAVVAWVPANLWLAAVPLGVCIYGLVVLALGAFTTADWVRWRAVFTKSP